MNKQLFSEVVLFEDIPDTGLEFTHKDLPGLLDGVPYCDPASEIKSHIRLTKRGKNVWATGSLSCTLDLTCHRCLEHYAFPLSVRYAYLMIPRGTGHQRQKEEVSLRHEELEVSFFDGVKIELFDVFREQVLLGLPMKQLCSEDCKGLCPGCGRNLNLERCSCEVKAALNPFSVLEKLKYA